MNETQVVITRRACQQCGTAVAVAFGPSDGVQQWADDVLDEYPGDPPDLEALDEPVFLYCESPLCDWCDGRELRQVRDQLADWCDGSAPTWEERVAALRERRRAER